MKQWVYVRTSDGHEGFVEVEKSQGLYGLFDQVSDKAAVIIVDPSQKFSQIDKGFPLSFAGSLALVVIVLLILAIAG